MPVALAREEEIQAQLVRDLYDRSRVSVLTLMIVLGVLRWTIDPIFQAEARVRLFFWLQVAVALARLLLAFVPERGRDAVASRRTQFVVFTVGASASAIALSALAVEAWPHLDTARICIVAVLVSGVVSGAVMSLGFSPIVYLAYSFPPLGALCLMSVTDLRPYWGADILATAFACFAAFVLAVSLDQRRTRRRAIELGLQLTDLVIRDTLTKLYNRRFLQEYLSIEEARLSRVSTDAARGKRLTGDVAMGVYMLDLDAFKQVNDVHGHAAGDAVLQQTAAVLSATLRKSDNLVRWGGEEFVAVSWVRDPEHPRIIAEKLRKAIEEASFVLPDGQVLRKTISIGYCVLPFFSGEARMLTWEQVLALADAALYLAKAEGRNRWVGVTAGPAAWSDTQRTCVEVLHDLRRAGEQGLIALDRARPPGAPE